MITEKQAFDRARHIISAIDWDRGGLHAKSQAILDAGKVLQDAIHAAEDARLDEIANQHDKIVAWVLTCRETNDRGWMITLAHHLDRLAELRGDPERVTLTDAGLVKKIRD